jgi:hypothetical protein
MREFIWPVKAVQYVPNKHTGALENKTFGGTRVLFVDTQTLAMIGINK